MAIELPQQELLSAYFDDELGGEERAQIETLLANDARYADLLNLWKRQRQQLQDLPRFQAAADLADRVVGQATTAKVQTLTPPLKQNSNWRLTIAAIASLAALLLVALTVLPGRLNETGNVARQDSSAAAPPDALEADADPLDSADRMLADDEDSALEEVEIASAQPAPAMDESLADQASGMGGSSSPPTQRFKDSARVANSSMAKESGTRRSLDPAPAGIAAAGQAKVRQQSPAARGMSVPSVENFAISPKKADRAISVSPNEPLVAQVVLYQRVQSGDALAIENLKSTLLRNNVQLKSVESLSQPIDAIDKNVIDSIASVSNGMSFMVSSTPEAMRSALTELSTDIDIAVVPTVESSIVEGLAAPGNSFADKDANVKRESDLVVGDETENEASVAPSVSRNDTPLAASRARKSSQNESYFTDNRSQSRLGRTAEVIDSTPEQTGVDESVVRDQSLPILNYRSRNRAEAGLVVEQLYQQQVGALADPQATANYMLILELSSKSSSKSSKTDK